MVATQLMALVVFGCGALILSPWHKGTKVASALRITSIEVPSAVMNSSQVTLACIYELQGDQLYSVKWYKNYVEFYRFQPSQTPASQDSQQQQLSFGSKQEFELEGINLNLSKSNATHVHLKQTSLSSEGTYKCEISADSPSFATISSERQMKVYVLPRQKLSIVDNTIQQQQAPTSEANNLINLTCISAPARPTPRLRWFINDLPVLNSSKWLHQHHSPSSGTNQAPQLKSQQLTETRLTLAFRFQPNLLAQMLAADSNVTNSSGRRMQLMMGKQLEFKCAAELSLEFAAETSIAVAGGKATQVKRRNRDRPNVSSSAGQLIAAPLLNQEETLGDHLRPINNHNVRAETGALRLGAGAELRPLVAGTQSAAVPPVRHQQQQQPLQGVVVLTNKQLRSKADQIEQSLRLIRPNDLQPPLIEARSQVVDYAYLEPDQIDSGDDGEKSSASVVANGEASAGSSEEESSRFNLPSDRASSSSEDDAAGDDDQEGDKDKDYQLNELVLFTCSLQPAQLPIVQANIHFRWFINNKDINSQHINHYDGNRFYHIQPSNSKLARRKQASRFPSSSGQHRQAELRRSDLLVEFTPSLFQLKELDLKCRTWIEQPLLEYETSLQANASASQPMPEYIEAERGSAADGASSQASSSRNQHNRPWVLKQSQQQRRNQVLRLQKQQQQQQKSSASASPLSPGGRFCLLPPIVFVVNLLIVAQRADQTR